MKRKVAVTLILDVEVNKGGWKAICRAARNACKVEIAQGSMNIQTGVISTVKGPMKIPTTQILD